MSRRVISAVTGGSGFIGQRLVAELLSRGDHVHILSRKRRPANARVAHFLGDLTRRDDRLDDFLDGVDTVYHCAGEIRDPTRMHALHVVGTQDLLERARGRVRRWVQLSSVGAYGAKTGLINEASPEVPRGPYEVTKTMSDDLVRRSGIPFAILRPSNVFGADMPNRSLFQWVSMVRRRLFFFVGPPGARVDYVHVNDVVRALMLCGSLPAATGETFVVSQSTRVERMVAAFARGQGVRRRPPRLPIRPVRLFARLARHVPRFPLTEARVRALTRTCHYDSAKIVRMLDFEFDAPLEQQLEAFSAGAAST